MSAKPFVLRGVSRRFGDVEALAPVDLEIDRHELVAVVGPSGCGKTTLLNILSGHDKPSTGTVTRSGSARMIYQHGGLFPWLTVAENVEMGLRHVADPAERARQVADLVALIRLEPFAGHYPHLISGGMRQRVELARALAGNTDVLLMDEPFSALDYFTRLRLRDELSEMLAVRPRTVVLVTHDVNEAAQLADRVVVMSGRPGRVRCELRLELPRPRNQTHPVVVETVHRILAELGLENDAGGADGLMTASARATTEE
jgi:ABC-type nitrate/sulfonate/bicarbonate transport system ATPase subunit